MSDQVLGKLNKEQFFKWSFYLEKLKQAKTAYSLEQAKISLLAKDLEITKLKGNLESANLSKFEAAVNKCEDMYNAAKLEIEGELGFKLEDVAIDDVTLEIIKLGD